VAPSAMWWGSDFAINCNNPYMSDDIGTKLCGSDYGTDRIVPTYIGYRPVAEPAQGRIGDMHYSDFRVTGGVRGDIAEGISYDVNVLHWSTDFNFLYKNDIDQNRAAAALLAVDDGSGNVVCMDSSYGSCVPADVFGYGKLSAQALDFLYGTTFTNTQVSQSVYSGVISSDLTSYGVVSPWAETGVGFVIGAEYRKDGTQTRYDEVLIQANNTPVPPSTIKAFEVFAELEVPVIEDKPFFESLTFNAGYRISDYKASQEGIAETSDYSAHTYKMELDWSPIPDVRFRASYNHALRAPNIGELFGAVGLGNVSGQDPCSGATPTASLAICKLTGVTDAMYGNISECPADVCVARSGGNVGLKPEEADTYTVGVVLTPEFLPGLTLTADYYDIKITGYIDSIDATSIMNQCVQGNEYFCKLFHRAPGSGILFGTEGWIESSLQNSGFLRTKGFDIGGTYSFDTESAGSFTANLNGTYMTSWEKEEIVGLPTFDCAGLFGPGCGQPAPKWRHNARVTWTDPWGIGSLSLAWRHIGATTLTFNEDDQFLGGDKYNVNDRIDAYNYIDLSGSAPLNDNIDVRFGINNLFDKSAPAIAAGLLAEFGNGNTYPGVYSVMGRNIFVGLTANF
ncbi:MAG: TonB-dependent receptor, partial [Kordiimonas sp.]